MLVMWLAILAPLLEAFDRFVERYAVNASAHERVPELHTVQWGTLGRSYGPPVRYFRVRLWSFEYMQRRDYGRLRNWCWHRRLVVWTSTEGWFEWFEPCDERSGPPR